jgi:anti-sigma regulatory factor (Ser/Thr protein kinase)
VTLRFRREAGAVVVTVEDAGIPFDPAAAVAPRLGDDSKHRALGGLGWHLVRHVIDEVRHEPLPGGGNRVTLIKRSR